MEDQTVENLIEKMAFLGWQCTSSNCQVVWYFLVLSCIDTVATATAVDSYVEMILSDWRDRKHCLKSEKVGSMKKKVNMCYGISESGIAMVLWHFMSFVRETRLVGSAVTFSPAWYFRRESGCWWGGLFSRRKNLLGDFIFADKSSFPFHCPAVHVHWRLHLVTLMIQNVSSSLFRNPWNCTKCPPLPAPLFTKYLWSVVNHRLWWMDWFGRWTTTSTLWSYNISNLQ